MTGPTFAPVDADTGDLLDLIADDDRKADDYASFLRACETDAECHGYVSVNRVRKCLSNEFGLTIHPQTYAAFWNKATGKNGGKPQPKRLWVG